MENIEDLENELKMILRLLIDKVLDNFEVGADEDGHREIVETGCKYVGYLVCDRLLIAPFEERAQLLCVSQSLLRSYFFKLAL